MLNSDLYCITIYEKPGIGTPEYYDTLDEVRRRIEWCFEKQYPFTVGNPHREGLRG